MCYSEDPRVNTPQQIRNLIKSGASVNAVDYRLTTPLLVCAASGRDDLVKVLIEEGADPSLRDSTDRGMKSIATFYGHTKIADLFDKES